MWVLYSMIATFVIAQIIVNVFVASSKKSSTTAGNKVKDSPDKPVERIRGQEDKRWISLHNEYAQESRNAHSIDVVFFGDSITQHMLNSQAWEEITKMHKVLNFGVGGDRTQHLLWRMDNGELEFKQAPKAVVIMIGTNNLGVDRPAEIAEGAFKAVDRVRQKYPTTIILLVAIPPRSKFAENPIRRDRQLYNEILEQRAAELGSSVRFVAFPDNEVLHPSTREFSRKYTVDFVHLTNRAYEALVIKALLPEISRAVAGANHRNSRNEQKRHGTL